LSKIIGGGTPSRNELSYWGGDIPWLTVKDMRSRRPAAAQEHITERAVAESATSIIPPDTVITATRVGLGKVVRVPYAAAINQDLKALIAGPGLDKSYLEYWIVSIAAFLESIGSGTTVKGIRLETLRQLPFPLAPLAEQREIVAELEKHFSRLDEAVANLQRVKANLKRYKASVLKDAVEGRLVPTEAELARREGRSFETGEQLLQRILGARRTQWNKKGKFKEAAAPVVEGLPKLPEGWAWARLDSVAALKGGITVDSKRADPTASMVPYLRVANVQRGYLDLTEIKQINASDEDAAELRLKFGDILFNEGGDRDKLGRGWIWENQLADCIHQNHVFRARVFLPEMVPKLISWWGNTFGKDYFQRVGKQTTNLASINLGKLSEFPVPIPPAAEQLRLVAEIERLLSVVDRVAIEVDANLKRAQSLRSAVLAKSFEIED
ncbi:MAG: restriction endonuclease subunit S, partial [Aeromicrobium sp.]|nr:restriction endonuclease subunit S [Burkholderiales bacterium]